MRTMEDGDFVCRGVDLLTLVVVTLGIADGFSPAQAMSLLKVVGISHSLRRRAA